MFTWVFPGQGSQIKGMGKELFDEFASLTAEADAILGYSIKELCLQDPLQRLNLTQYTQPALFVVNAFSYLKRCQKTNHRPDFVAGHSLGEYNALFASGAIDFATGVKLVKKRGELMGQANGGAMAAIVQLSEEQLHHLLQKHHLSNIDIANYNSPHQIVISGSTDVIQQAIRLLTVEGGMGISLKVSAAFHSRHMQPAKEQFECFLQDTHFSALTIPVISNVTARPYIQAEISGYLSQQLTCPVRWTESIRYLMGRGDMKFEEIGPGTVLTKLVAKIQQEAEPLILPESLEAPAIQDERHEIVSPKIVAQELEPVARRPITASSLGSEAFKQEYHLKYAYVTGAMVRGVASTEMVIAMGKAGLMGYWGAGGASLTRIEEALQHIQQELRYDQTYGMNLLCNVNNPPQEEAVVDLYLKYAVRNIEASAYMQLTPALVRYRLKGLRQDQNGRIIAENRIMAKLSRPEVALAFLHPAPQSIVEKLLAEGKISSTEAALSQRIPMATALCVESDSGGHTDQGIMAILLPTIIRLRNEQMNSHADHRQVWVGAAGGIGAPEAAAAAFALGADFILTGSINQCTVEAGTSDAVKDILQGLQVQDTDYAPAADMFELGAKVQVVRKGVFFPARANKLYDLYRFYESWSAINEKTRRQIEDNYFQRGFSDVWDETKHFLAQTQPWEIERAEANPRYQMALVFRWYLWYTMQLAIQGKIERKVDFQIHCGPAMGAFNQWVKGTSLEYWRNRHVDRIADTLMQETASFFDTQMQYLQKSFV